MPPVVTSAPGDAVFTVSANRRNIHYRLTIRNIAAMTVAHIHLGRRGENGPVVVFLFGPVDLGITVDQGVVQGSIRQNDLEGPLAGKSFAELISQMEAGNTYVNVHTRRNPEGEIRGQIKDRKGKYRREAEKEQ